MRKDSPPFLPPLLPSPSTLALIYQGRLKRSDLPDLAASLDESLLQENLSDISKDSCEPDSSDEANAASVDPLELTDADADRLWLSILASLPLSPPEIPEIPPSRSADPPTSLSGSLTETSLALVLPSAKVEEPPEAATFEPLVSHPRISAPPTWTAIASSLVSLSLCAMVAWFTLSDLTTPETSLLPSSEKHLSGPRHAAPVRLRPCPPKTAFLPAPAASSLPPAPPAPLATLVTPASPLSEASNPPHPRPSWDGTKGSLKHAFLEIRHVPKTSHKPNDPKEAALFKGAALLKSDAQIRVGDGFLFRFLLLRPGHLYLLRQDEAGKLETLFPFSTCKDKVRTETSIRLMQDGVPLAYFLEDALLGRQTFLLVWSSSPIRWPSSVSQLSKKEQKLLHSADRIPVTILRPFASSP